MYYDDLNYAKQRLEETIVKTKEGIPVFIRVVDTTTSTCSAEVLDTGDIINIPIINIDLSPVPLGYINTFPEALYAMRKPVRAYKQGLATYSVYFSNTTKRLNKFPSRELSKTIQGKFPSLDEAISQVGKKTNVVAWHRHFAICDQGNLHYKGKLVGTREGSTFDLSPKYIYLYEHLQETLATLN